MLNALFSKPAGAKLGRILSKGEEQIFNNIEQWLNYFLKVLCVAVRRLSACLCAILPFLWCALVKFILLVKTQM